MPPDWREVDPTEERKSVRFALEPVFEDDLITRRERDEEGGCGWSFYEEKKEGGHWVRVYRTRTGVFWDSNQALAESSEKTLLFAVEGLLKFRWR